MQGDTITATINSNFNIRLGANPGTGYRWEMTKPVDSNFILLLNNDFEKPKKELDNDTTWQVLTFKAIKKGTTTIELLYKRPWESNEKMTNKKSYSVIIQ